MHKLKLYNSISMDIQNRIEFLVEKWITKFYLNKKKIC